MPGTLIDGVFADAVTKGIAPDLHENMLTAMLQTAQKTDPHQHFGRHGNESYKALGYLPDDFHESVSHSLDYACSDFCIATVAKQFGAYRNSRSLCCFQSLLPNIVRCPNRLHEGAIPQWNL